MELKRIENIERLLERMREENSSYSKKKPVAEQNEESSEEEQPQKLPSRYPIHKPASSSEDSEELSEEEAPENNSPSFGSFKPKLGPPMRVEKQPQEKPQRPGTAKAPRPSSARTLKTPSVMYSQTPRKKKTDPVSLFQQRQREWKSNPFLKANTNKQGRKLNLAPSNFQKDFYLVKNKNVHDYRYTYKPPHEKRRDDVRLNTRMRLMSQDM